MFRNWRRDGDGLSYLSAFLPQLGIAQVIRRNVNLVERKRCDKWDLRIAVGKPEKKPKGVWDCSEEQGGV